VWLRKALFQVHLWTGIGAGLYVLLISISGSAIVFRNEIYESNDSPVIIVEGAGDRMKSDRIRAAAEAAWPGYEVIQIYEFEDNPKRAVEVRLEKGSQLRNQLFDPFTGKDLGPSVPWPIRVMSWFEDLHINLFGGKTGRQINAVGGGLWAVLALTGMVIWWQGIQNWTRGLLLRWRSGWKRFNWDLHSSVGIWTLLLTLMWGVTGIFAAIPNPFRDAVDYLEPLKAIPQPPRSETQTTGGQRGQQENAAGGRGQRGAQDPGAAPGQGQGRGRGRGRRQRFEPRVGDAILRGAYALHFGNFAGAKVKVTWVVLGLVPGVLFLTGVVMWVNRVVRKLPL